MFLSAMLVQVILFAKWILSITVLPAVFVVSKKKNTFFVHVWNMNDKINL